MANTLFLLYEDSKKGGFILRFNAFALPLHPMSEYQPINNSLFDESVRALSHISEQEQRFMPDTSAALPSVEVVEEIVDLVRKIIFPDYFDCRQSNTELRTYHIGANMEQLFDLLCQQIGLALQFRHCRHEHREEQAFELTRLFVRRIAEIKRVLLTDIEAIYTTDPAATQPSEVIFSYPVTQAMLHYRIAHELQVMGVPVIPRIITEKAHSQTGIDIHPDAQIGEYFAIYHGTGVVIGQTCVIGNRVTLFQGVTLGAGVKRRVSAEAAENRPRHPIIGDRVTIYANSTLLGRITIGHDTVIGGNIWVTHDVPPHSNLRQSKFIDTPFEQGLGI